jgi:hypothetical protein
MRLCERLFEYIEMLWHRSAATDKPIISHNLIKPDANVAFYHLGSGEIMVDIGNATKGGGLPLRVW